MIGNGIGRPSTVVAVSISETSTSMRGRSASLAKSSRFRREVTSSHAAPST